MEENVTHLTLSEAETALRALLTKTASERSDQQHYVVPIEATDNASPGRLVYRSTSEDDIATVVKVAEKILTVRRGLAIYRRSDRCQAPVVVWFIVTGDQFEICCDYLVDWSERGTCYLRDCSLEPTIEAIAALEKLFRDAVSWA